MRSVTNVDFNTDGNIDIRLTAGGSTGSSTYRARVRPLTANGANVNWNGGQYARRFTKGQTISSGLASWGGDGASGTLFYHSGGSFADGPFDNLNTGYVGLRFSPSGNPGGPYYYTWMHIDSIAANGKQYHVDDYAYEDSGGSIKAGDKPVPEPSTIALALLASGAAGVMRSRRQKILKGRGACGRRTAAQKSEVSGRREASGAGDG